VAEHGGPDGEAGEVTRIAGSMTDQTERKMTDPLTGLPNRMYFIDHLERRLERARENETWDFAVLSLAIERFKMLNESLGYAGGDALLLEMASRLTDVMAECAAPTEPVIARVNGAEFLVCMEGVAGEQQAIAVPAMSTRRYASLSSGAASVWRHRQRWASLRPMRHTRIRKN
jgi:diguanylate cyclase (GGDEF)-like protein